MGFALAAFSHSPVAAQAQNDDVLNRQGVWGGGYSRGRSEKISLELHVIRDVGQLEIDFRGWEPVKFANCQYVFDASVTGDFDLLLNGSHGTPEECPVDFSVGFKRTGPDAAELTFTNASFLDNAELSAGLRPLRDADRRASVEGLDVLGVATGMAQDAVEASLEKTGYAPMPDWTQVVQARDESWSLETRSYVRQQDGDEWGDVFTVQYSPNVKGEENGNRAALISRNWKIPEDQNVSELTLVRALKDKYGPILSMGEDRAWDRNGENLTTYDDRRQRCAEGSLQQLPFSISFRESSLRSGANPYCGPTADIRIQTGINSGIATGLNVFVMDPDEIWDGFWRTWSAGEYAKLKQLFDSVSGATGAAPEL
ncbi:hypothetical protein LL06_14460 [Hoeflea sp. BAL378]|nr:hypothetical protein LL06_14460 [Hoeflea sp. BAL378]